MYKEKIEKIAESLHETLNIKSMPVAVEEIAESLGIRVKRASSKDFKEELSGLLIRKDGKALIGVNSDESLTRQRFTIAHELGHYFLHKTDDTFVDYRDNNSGIAMRNLKERQANIFAASFLMPRKLLLSDMKKFEKEGIYENEIEKLAKKYDVSKEAMNYRVINLSTK